MTFRERDQEADTSHGVPTTLAPEETTELDRYEELDEYLSFLNRMVRNMLAAPQK